MSEGKKKSTVSRKVDLHLRFFLNVVNMQCSISTHTVLFSRVDRYNWTGVVHWGRKQ